MTSIMGWAQMLADGRLDPETSQTGIEAIGKSAKVQAQPRRSAFAACRSWR